MLTTHGQQPNAGNVALEWKDAILHARMTIGETELLGADVPPERFWGRLDPHSDSRIFSMDR